MDWDRIWSIRPWHDGNVCHPPGHSEVSGRFETRTDTQTLNIILVLKYIHSYVFGLPPCVLLRKQGSFLLVYIRLCYGQMCRGVRLSLHWFES